jgi:hypothetical protein
MEGAGREMKGRRRVGAAGCTVQHPTRAQRRKGIRRHHQGKGNAGFYIIQGIRPPAGSKMGMSQRCRSSGMALWTGAPRSSSADRPTHKHLGDDRVVVRHGVVQRCTALCCSGRKRMGWAGADGMAPSLGAWARDSGAARLCLVWNQSVFGLVWEPKAKAATRRM